MNLIAFAEGMDARRYDEDNGGISDNPYTAGSHASIQWFQGYNMRSDVPCDDSGLEITNTKDRTGLCHDCSQPVEPGKSRCRAHLAVLAQRAEYYRKSAKE